MWSLETAQTFLFVPGTRPDRFDRAERSGAHVVILDLEDAVPAADKAVARSHVVDRVAQGSGEHLIRINDPSTAEGRSDVAALRAMGPVRVMVPKAEAPEVLHEVVQQLPEGSRVVALIETARGVEDAARIASVAGVVRLALGHLDLCAELGVDPDDWTNLVPVRSALLTASLSRGLPHPIDGVTVSTTDTARIHGDTQAARRAGFRAKLCIHPGQLESVRRALEPTQDEVRWARRVLQAASADGASQVDGQMVDRPVYLRALGIVSGVGE